jgi:chromate transport protein ChrA
MRRLWAIARMGLLLGATVFGGVAAAYPLVRDRAAELGDLTGEEVDGLYALSVLLPGPSFLNLWGAVSARAGGWAGALVGQVSLLLPAFLLVLVLPLLKAIPWVGARADGAMHGAIWATAGLLLATGVDGLRKQKSVRELAMVAGLLGALLLGVHPVLLLVLVLGWGAVSGRRTATRAARGEGAA